MPSSFPRPQVLALGCLLACACTSAASPPAAASPRAVAGALDLGGAALAEPVRLDGEWLWQPGALVAPGRPLPAPRGYALPGIWNGRPGEGPGGGPLPAEGHGTFRLRLRLPAPGSYGLLLRYTACAYRLYADEVLVAQSGVVGERAEATVPASLTRAVAFTAPRDEVTLTLQLSSYHHARGGPRASLLLGRDDQVRALRDRQLVLYAFAIGCLAILVLYQLALYLLRRKDPLPLYLALFAGLMGLWLSMHGPLLFTLLFPALPYERVIRIEYLSFYCAPAAGSLFLGALFPRDTPRHLLRVILAVSLVPVLVVLALPPRLYTATLPAFAALAALCATAQVAVVLRAVRRRRPEARLLLLGVLGLFLAVLIDAGKTLAQPLYVDASTPAGLLGLVLMEALVVSRRSARAHALVEEQAAELQRQSAASHRFVPEAFLRLLGKADITAVRLGDRAQRDMTVLFADVRGFTALSERMSIGDTFAFVNRLLGAIGPIIRAHGGFIDKYLGDGIMALFPGSPEDAYRAAVAIRRALAESNGERAARGEEPVRIGIGVHAGTLMLGTVGEPERMDGTVIADAVNTAARLEGLTARFGVEALVSAPVVAALPALGDGGERGVRALGAVRPKGKQAAVRIYELFDGDDEAVAQRKRAGRADFEAALAAYEGGRFAEARDRFAAVLAACPEDGAAACCLARAERLLGAPAPPGWDGVEVLTEK